MQTVDQREVKVGGWLAARKEAALRLDPETAEYFWVYGYVLDPYGVEPQEEDNLGRVYFARSPTDGIAVCFYDLPEKVCKRLWERIDAGELRNAFAMSCDDLPWDP